MQLASHLADCPDCGTWAESERRIDEHIGHAMRAVAVPPMLSLHLMRRLGVERDAWYRGWMVRAVGIAAGLLVAVWLGWALWWNHRPGVDLGGIAQLVDVPLSSPEQVEDWFDYRLGVSMTAPPQFNYALLFDEGRAEFQGKLVPYLLFHDPKKPEAIAKVYVLSARQFNLEEARKQTVPQGSRRNVTVLLHPTNSGVLYVGVCPAGVSLDSFFTAKQ